MRNLRNPQEVKLAAEIIIDQFGRYREKLDENLGLIVEVEYDRTYTCMKVEVYYTTWVAPVSADPRMQEDDDRISETVIVPIGVPVSDLEDKVLGILEGLKNVKPAA